jgi:hypothetical protein
MSSTVGGLQAKINEKYSIAVYFHCTSNKLALVITDICKHIRSSIHIFNLLEMVYINFYQPSSRFNEIQKIKLSLKPN